MTTIPASTDWTIVLLSLLPPLLLSVLLSGPTATVSTVILRGANLSDACRNAVSQSLPSLMLHNTISSQTTHFAELLLTIHELTHGLRQNRELPTTWLNKIVRTVWGVVVVVVTEVKVRHLPPSTAEVQNAQSFILTSSKHLWQGATGSCASNYVSVHHILCLAWQSQFGSVLLSTGISVQ